MKHGAIDRRAIPAGATLSTWAAGDGWKIRRFDWQQPEPAAARGSLFFANGRGDFVEKYLEPLAYWHEAGWNVTSFDWRGQGQSRGSIVGGHIDDFDALVEDGRALMAAWQAESPGPHVAIGHSMGGHLLLRILAEHRPALAAAVLVAPMIAINSAPLPTAIAQMIAQSLTSFGWGRVPVWSNPNKGGRSAQRQAILTSCPDRYADEGWWYDREPGYALGAPSWGWLVAAYRSMARLTPEQLESVKVPLLLLGSARDRLVDPAAIGWAAGLLPQAVTHIYPEAAHEILREADAVRLDALRRIDMFFDLHAKR